MVYKTESDLREEYKRKPFDRYIINKDIKLTPGAKQFLTDRKIGILNEEESNLDDTLDISKDEKSSEVSESSIDCEVETELQLLKAKLMYHTAFIRGFDQMLSDRLMYFIRLLSDFNDEESLKSFEVKPCKGISEDGLHIINDSCFEIPEEIINSSKGPIVCSLELIRCEIVRFYRCYYCALNNTQRVFLAKMSNNLLQLIHQIVGGDICLRKIKNSKV